MKYDECTIAEFSQPYIDIADKMLNHMLKKVERTNPMNEDEFPPMVV